MCRIFKEYSRNYFIDQLLLMGRIFLGIFLHMQLFAMFLFHFFTEYSRNIFQVRPHPQGSQRNNRFSYLAVVMALPFDQQIMFPGARIKGVVNLTSKDVVYLVGNNISSLDSS